VTRKLLVTIIIIAAFVGACAGIIAGVISTNDDKHYSGRSGQQQYCQDQGWKYDAKSNSCVR
jgi:hypothetical protein